MAHEASYDEIIAKIFGMEGGGEKDDLKRLIMDGKGKPLTKENLKKQGFLAWPETDHGDDHGILGKKTWLIFSGGKILDKFKSFDPSGIQKFDLNAFFNLLSPLDMSLSVPYLQIHFRKRTQRQKGADSEGLDPVGDFQLENNDLMPLKFTNLQYDEEMVLGVKGVLNSLFFTPQTFYGSPGVEGEANKFRPPMAIKSFKVSIVNPFGMIAVNHATMVIKMFDTARLNQLSNLIMPGKNAPIWDIEYGWSHPGGQSTSPSHNTFAAQFINARRDHTQYIVTNFNVTMNQDNTADISLNLMSTPAEQLTRVNFLKDTDFAGYMQKTAKLQRKYDVLQKAADKKRAAGKGKGNLDKTARAKLKTAKRFNYRSLDLTDTKINRKLNEELISKFKLIFDITEGSETSKLNEFAGGTFGTSWQIFETILAQGRFKKITKKDAKTAKSLNKQFTSLAIILSYMFRELNADVTPIVETQIIFGTFNKNAGLMAGMNIGSFVIHGKKLSKAKIGSGFIGLLRLYMLSTKQMNPSINDLIDFIRNRFVNDPSNFNYGLATQLFKTEGLDGGGRTLYQPKGKLPENFTTPKLKAYIKDYPMASVDGSHPEGIEIVRRVFIYDETAMNIGATPADVMKAIGGTDKGLEALVHDKPEDKPPDPSWQKMTEEIRKNVPYIKLGTERTTVKSLSMATFNDPLQETVFMQKAEDMANANDIETGFNANSLPQTFFPMKVNMSIWGFPDIQFGGLVFIDSRTRSTVDNIYRIVGINHDFSAEGISTNLELVPDSVWKKIRAKLKEK
tara:strand:+ start:6823 stop:9192 length:2370 start_codon:yes stop_codon:yes gene_type:complete